jgi:hypothetical protein
MSRVRRSIIDVRFQRLFRTAISVGSAFLALSTPHAQSGPPPTFDASGFQRDRAHFSQFPFESVDMINGNLMLSFTDLSLPGDAGLDLTLVRAYSRQATGLQWTFGIAGVPILIAHPDGNGNQCCDNPVLIMADGTHIPTVPVNSVLNDTEFVTDSFWHYSTSTRTLELPSGLTASYEGGTPSGGAMLLEFHESVR